MQHPSATASEVIRSIFRGSPCWHPFRSLHAEGDHVLVKPECLLHLVVQTLASDVSGSIFLGICVCPYIRELGRNASVITATTIRRGWSTENSTSENTLHVILLKLIPQFAYIIVLLKLAIMVNSFTLEDISPKVMKARRNVQPQVRR